ncbi:recombinase family protein [Nonomuraea sp. NPDC003560]|uniref:recombinase family protein n=1 Tax=Nonomuraea sp. NPDC003560 TaxID=3364341 RepID=UPI00367CD7B4
MALIGLVRVSTDKQKTQRQHDALDPICLKVFEETISGKLATDDRPALLDALSYLRDGDMLTVQEVDRLGRNLLEGLIVLNDLFQRGIAVKVLEGIAAGEHTERSLILDLALALSEDRRRDIVRKTRNGLEAARLRGRVGGRPPVVDDDKRAAILDRRRRGESIRTIAAGVKVSVGVVHKTLAAAEAPPSPLIGSTATVPVTASVDQAHEGDHDDDEGHALLPPVPVQERALEEPAAGNESQAARALRTVARLGPDWATDDNDVLWWRREMRAGSVSPAWPGTGWTARTAQHIPITTGAGKRGAYPSRIKALTAVAADFEARRRARTEHADVALDGAPGWRLRQTQADHDRHRWNVVAPTGEIAGTVTRAGWHDQAWEATAGDPATRHYYPVPVQPIGDEPGRSSAEGCWRTRNAAALAVARWHDPA